MAKAVKKEITDFGAPSAGSRVSHVNLASDGAPSIDSPALLLQAQLRQQAKAARVEKYPPLYVTSTVIVVCLSFWLSLAQLSMPLIA